MTREIPLARIQAAGYDAWPTWAVYTQRRRVHTHIIPPMSSTALCGLLSEWAIDSQLGNGAGTCPRCIARFEKEARPMTNHPIEWSALHRMAWRAWRYGTSRAYHGPWTKTHLSREGWEGSAPIPMTLCGILVGHGFDVAVRSTQGAGGTCERCLIAAHKL